MNEKVTANLERLRVMALDIKSEIECMLEDIEDARNAEDLDSLMSNTFCISAQLVRIGRKTDDMGYIVRRAEELFDE